MRRAIVAGGIVLACACEPPPPEAPPPPTPTGPVTVWQPLPVPPRPDAGPRDAGEDAPSRPFDLGAIPVRPGTFACPPRAAATQAAPATIAELRARVFEGRASSCLDGKVVGLLSAERAHRSSGQAAQYTFNVDDDARRAIYFGAHGSDGSLAPVTVPTGDGKPAEVTIAARLLAPGDANGWRLSKSVHLARIEVNDGHGSPAGATKLVATDVMLLDKSGEYPIDVDAALRDFVDPMLDEKRPNVVQLRARMANAMANVVGNNPLPGAVPKSSELRVSIGATWRRDAEQLEMTYFVQRYDRVERRTKENQVGSRDYYVDYAERAVRDKRGNVVPVQPMPIEARADAPVESVK